MIVDRVDAVLAEAAELGVRLRVVNGKLRFAPIASVTPSLKAGLAECRDAIVERLTVPDGGFGEQRPSSPPPPARPATSPHSPPPLPPLPSADPYADRWPVAPQVCCTCWGTRFVDLRDGRRWACFTCAAPEAGEVVAECDNGPERPERARAWARGTSARGAEERAAGVRTADGATQSQASCGRELADVSNRPKGAESTVDEVRF